MEINVKKDVSVGSAFGKFIGELLGILLRPLVVFFFAYIGGSLLQWGYGVEVAEALNTMLNTARFSPDHVPAIVGALSLVGNMVFKPRKSIVVIENKP